MTLIPSTDEDLEFGRRIHHSAYREMVVRQFGEWDEKIQDEFFEKTWAAHPHYIIYNAANERCGYCAIERSDSGIILREIAISPENQGKGIGSNIIQTLLAEAAEQKFSMKLNVMKSNSAARRLYERLGFRQTGENNTHFLMQAS